LSAGRGGLFVVEVAAVRCSPAAGEGAGLLAGDDECREVGWWPVGCGAAIEQGARGGIGDQATPGAGRVGGDVAREHCRDGAVPGELAGLLVPAEQVDSATVTWTVGRMPCALGSSGSCSAATPRSTRASARRWSAVRGSSAGWCGRGERVNRGADCGCAFGGQQRPQLAHAVIAWGEADPAIGQRLLALLLGAGRCGGGDGAAPRAFELGQRLLARTAQHALFDLSVVLASSG